MTPEQEKQWREEFEGLQFKYKNNLDRTYNGYVDSDIHRRWIMYEAARKKAQEEIDKLNNKIANLERNRMFWVNEVIRLKENKL